MYVSDLKCYRKYSKVLKLSQKYKYSILVNIF